MHKYRLISKKGEGTFSEVLKAQSIKNGKYLAIKCMKNHFDSIDQVNNLREIQALRRLSPNPHIIKLYEVLYDQPTGRLALVFELMDMNIYEHIRGRRHYLPEPRVKAYMWQLIKAMDHMHRNGIFHRDVKPENILITDEVLKVADFGSCRGIYSKQPYTEYISTRWYRAPECLLTDGYYGYKMDMWGVGCVMFEVLALFPLFPGTDEVDQINKIHNVLGTPPQAILDKFKRYASHMDFNFPPKEGTGIAKMVPHISGDCADIIEKLLAYDPEERLSARQALKHPYFREMYKQDGLSEQEDVGQVKKGFAPFKPQRRRKKEKGSDSKTRPEDDVKQQKADQKVSPVKDLEKPKQIANKPSNKTGREKGPPANAPVPGRTSKDNSSKAAKVVTNSQKYTTSSSSQQPQAKVDNGRSRDDRHKGRRSERERDREERRRKRERRERREQRAAEASGSVAPAGSQVLPPISKSTHGSGSNQPKSIQSLKIDMAPGAKHRSSHRHHQHPKSHRMPGHKNSSYGYGSSKYPTSNAPGANYNKMKYYSSVADGSTKRHGHRSNRVANRGYVGHNHYSSNQSGGHHQSGYHKSKSGNPGKVNRGMFGLPSNNRNGGGGQVVKGSNIGQYGRHGYQARKGGAPQASSRAPGRYESPYSQKALKHEQGAGARRRM